MKKGILFIAIALMATTLHAQTNQPGCYASPKTIWVTGSAEMEIIPNEIFVQVNLRDYKQKGEDKISL